MIAPCFDYVADTVIISCSFLRLLVSFSFRCHWSSPRDEPNSRLGSNSQQATIILVADHPAEKLRCISIFSIFRPHPNKRTSSSSLSNVLAWKLKARPTTCNIVPPYQSIMLHIYRPYSNKCTGSSSFSLGFEGRLTNCNMDGIIIPISCVAHLYFRSTGLIPTTAQVEAFLTLWFEV